MANLSTMKKGSSSKRGGSSSSKPAASVKPAKPARKSTPLHIRVAARLRKTAERLRSLESKVAKWIADAGGEVEAAQGNFEVAVVKLQNVVEHIEKLPLDYAAKTPRATAAFDVGSKVRVKEARREQFSELLDSAELDGLEVVAQNGRSYRCKTATGTQLFFKGRDLEQAA
jgi:hypothetical protein